jgi:chromosome segregation ATPase
MKFEQLVERFLRLEKWFKTYQGIVHYLNNKIKEIFSIHQDIVKRYSSIQKDLDEIKLRQQQEKSFRDSTRHKFQEFETQFKLLDESFKETEKNQDNFIKAINNNKKLKKLFDQEGS